MYIYMYIYYMDNGVSLETKTLVEHIRHYIRDQVHVRHFHCCCFENTNGLWFVFKTKLTLEIKRKHLKDILR